MYLLVCAIGHITVGLVSGSDFDSVSLCVTMLHTARLLDDRTVSSAAVCKAMRYAQVSFETCYYT